MKKLETCVFAPPLAKISRARPLRVAISGHRWNKLRQADLVMVRGKMARVFAMIDRSARANVALGCGMAEGADLMAVSLMPPHWRLNAFLPAPPIDWRRHLQAQLSGTRFAEARQDMCVFDRALHRKDVIQRLVVPCFDYSALASELVIWSDMVIAVWDGTPGQAGGTAEVLSLAERHDLTIILLSV